MVDETNKCEYLHEHVGRGALRRARAALFVVKQRDQAHIGLVGQTGLGLGARHGRAQRLDRHVAHQQIVETRAENELVEGAADHRRLDEGIASTATSKDNETRW